ncbi:hypothetical protein Leryth_021815 [Lithospermum erythrorhizon]|nr:hypothetical protein Leryth_021815 [Lithospermum erythrorhizon]
MKVRHRHVERMRVGLVSLVAASLDAPFLLSNRLRMKRSVVMDMSEAVIDNIIMLFKNTEDDNDFLSDPICTFKHFFIEYLIKTGWNGWLIVTKYLPGVIRKSILNEVIDYCTSKSVN